MSNTLTVTESNNTLIVSGVGPQGPAGAGGAGGVSDGDKGDITVASSGTSWTIDANAISTAKIADDAVTFAKLQDITGPTVLGRQTGTGSTEQIGLAAAFTINGSKQLDLANALAASSTTLTAGTGLTGGGDLSANRTFAVAYGSTAGTACQGNDSRLSDARTPTAHTHAWSDITSGVPATFTPSAHTHALADIQQGGATSGQVLEWSGSAWAPATLSGGGGGTVTSVTAGDGLLGGTITGTGTIDCNFGTAGNTVCEGNDARLSDARTPTAHNHAASEITSGTLDIARVPIGTTGTTVCVGNDSRLSDARTPTAHTHALADIQQGGATSGQVPTWNGTAWAPATPSGGGGGSGAPSPTTTYENLEHFNFNLTTPREMVYGTINGGNVGNSSDPGKFGIVNISTGTTATAGALAVWRMSNSSVADGGFSTISEGVYSTSVKGLNLGDSTTTGIVVFGLARFVSGDPANGVYFRATDGGNWYAVTRNSSTETATDTGVAQNTTAFKRFTCRYTSSSCTFYIDGTLVATHTTNIPTTELNYGMMVYKSAAVTGQIRYTVDYLYAALTYSNPATIDP